MANVGLSLSIPLVLFVSFFKKHLSLFFRLHPHRATHTGRYTNVSSAIWDLDNFVIVSATGTVIAANGERVFWKMTPDQPGIVQIAGGTGRFKNASGSLAAVPPLEPIITVDVANMTMTITITYRAIGTITY